MTDRFTQLGFSQRIRLEWLEQTARLILAGTTRQAVFDALQALLHDKLSVGGHAERGNREKVITILMQIWVTAPPELACLRDAGLELLQQLPPDEHLAVHWGMTIAVYPFFGSGAGSVGRLLRLQGTAAAAQVQRRILGCFSRKFDRWRLCPVAGTCRYEREAGWLAGLWRQYYIPFPTTHPPCMPSSMRLVSFHSRWNGSPLALLQPPDTWKSFVTAWMTTW